MIERNERLKKLCSSLVDALLVFVAYLGAIYLRFNYIRFFRGGAGPAWDIAKDSRMLLGVAIYALALVTVFHLVRLYGRSRIRGLWWQCRVIVGLNLLGLVVWAAAFYYFRLGDFSRGVILLFPVLSTVALVAKRLAVRAYDRHQRAAGRGIKHILLAGGGGIAAKYLLALQQNPYYGFQVDGYLAAAPSPTLNCRYLGGFDKLGELLEGPQVDEVVIAFDTGEIESIPAVLNACDKNGTRVTMVPFYNDYLPARPTVDVLGDCKLINIRETPFDNLFNAAVKRLLDILGSLLLIVLTSPVLVVVAVGVKLSSPGPVLFKQERIGLNKKPFMMYKFRSMRQNAQQDTGWSKGTDPRKTKFGSLIRKFSLDELPQFFNVLKGDMSLVGPRPEVPYHVEHFKEEIPLYLVRQQVRPGCTGWAQVNGLRGDTDIAERIRYDIWYIENWTVALDLKIIFRTVFGGKMVNDEKLQ
ncbi:MAG: undecaprenyl-phosphate glucose phosphotransferase [Gemmiger sp.]|nr:undecaprenyl-phosphate glucose phosphotransferase [Gemmiger sp.]